MDLTDAELDVLKVLWEGGPATVRAIQAALLKRGRRWAYSTVATLIQRLGVKGFVAGNSESVPHVYRALVSRAELLDRRLRDTANDLCGGNAAPLMLALVEGGGFTDEELDRFREILNKARGGGVSRKRKGS